MNDFYMLWLSKVFSGNTNEIISLLKILTPEEIYNNKQKEELKILPKYIEILKSEKIKDQAKYEFEFCQKENIKIISFNSKNYPYNLINISSPPTVLYCKGEIIPSDEVSISIVGSRKYTEYGKACTKKFSSELSQCKITIVSGMAYGIDSFAHSYAIKSGGRTIAVLGSGIDVIYPSENKNLYYEIIENGAVISEFPLHTAPAPKNFPIRNRIVAGISMGTLVIEANEKSGTMITARLAGEFGRNIYAVPGGIFTKTSDGTNLLIKDGAKIVTSVNDIIEDIYCEISQTIPKPKQLSLFTKPELNKEENIIYEKLSLTPITIDKLIENINLPFNKVLVALSSLELSGYIKELPGKQYVINID